MEIATVSGLKTSLSAYLRPNASLPADFWDWLRPVDANATVRAAVSREREEGW